MKTIRIIGIVVLIVGSGLTVRVASAQALGTKRTDLQRHDLSVVGREVVQARVDVDPGYTSPRHKHPGEEIIYVLEGTLEYQIEGQPVVTVKTGDVLFVPAGAIHSVRNIGTGNGAELATYIVEKDKPQITPVNDTESRNVPGRQIGEQTMIIASIHFTFASKDADKAESLLRELRDASVKEPGVIQFEVGRSSDEPNVFALWEVYRDKDAVEAHRASEY